MKLSLVQTVATLGFGLVAWAQSACNTSTSINGIAFPSLIDVTLEELVVGLESGLFSSVDLVTAYIARIGEVNATLHAVTQLNPDAISIAQTLDAERANGTVRGPFHGVPILIKNNIATYDKMDNTAGSYALAGAKVSPSHLDVFYQRTSLIARIRFLETVQLLQTSARLVPSSWARRTCPNGPTFVRPTLPTAGLPLLGKSLDPISLTRIPVAVRLAVA
jgi:hypothetical protein